MLSPSSLVRILSKGTTIKTFLKENLHLSEIENLFSICESNLIEKLKISAREAKLLCYEIYLIEDKYILKKFLKNSFATIIKVESYHDLPSKRKDFYFICLNKPKIFYRKTPSLKELLLYILTHELIHLIRFIRYESNFYFINNWKEEKEVHILTKKVLKDFYFLPHIKKVFSYFDRVYS